MSGAPPREMIELAENMAAQSPCAKSKRGVVAYAEHASFDGPRVVGSGFNGPPMPFKCSGDAACRATCNKFCVHAELRAIWSAWPYLSGHPSRGVPVSLVHVKIAAGGRVVPGGGPSCWQCSRHVLEHGIHGVWLFEAPSGIAYTADDPAAPGVWRFYTADAFHRATLVAAELGQVHA